MLEAEADLEVVGDVGDGAAAVEMALATRPDVVLMDVQMEGVDGIAALKQLREVLPSARVIILTTFGHENYLILSSRAGASGYLLKDVSQEELTSAIRRVAAGETLIGVGAESDPISPRELEVLECMSQEMSNQAIAQALGITENTVKTHVSHLLNKLGASDRAGAVLRGWRQGLISSSAAGQVNNHANGG
jgi:DNA-binding NarL/FixJ family response regulator